MRFLTLCVVAVLWGALAGCDETRAQRDPDAGAPGDAAGDARVDAGGDAAVDGSVDGTVDAAPDAAPPEPDATVDAALDAQVDAAPPEPDFSDELFDPTRVLQVALELDPADWDTLRQQGRTGIRTAGEDCLDAPFPSPYTWFEARITIDGTTYERVGVRKRGFIGSLSENKPGLRIELDRHIDGQLHRSVEHMNLNNARQDPTGLRTCLAYGVFRRAGLPAPRCSLARVSVNGQDLGIYSHVEVLKNRFLRRNFGNDSGYLYEGTLSDFRAPWWGTMEQKTLEETPNRAPIEAIAQAATVPDAELLAALDQVIDLDAFITFWAAEVLTAHWDGYAGNTNNFWFYVHPDDGRARFIPWGADSTFEVPRLLFEGRQAPWSVMAIGVITRRLYLHPEGRARYLERLQQLITTAWDVPGMQADIERAQAQIQAALPEGQRARHTERVAELSAFVQDQPARVLAEVLAGPAQWRYPLRDTLCEPEAGAATGRFETTWGTWPTQNAFATGTGALEGTLSGRRFRSAQGGSAAGLDDGLGVLIVPISLVGGEILYAFVVLPPASLLPGPLTLDEGADCSLNLFDPASGASSRAASCLGQIDFTALSTEPGGPVAGTLDLVLYAR